MKRTGIFTVAVLILLSFLTGCGGKVWGVQKNIEPSEIYSPAEINRAMNVVIRHFSVHFKGCSLLELTYDEDWNQEYGSQESQRYGSKDVIILSSTFSVNTSGSDGSLNPNSVYENWRWYLTRVPGGSWKLQDWGYG